MRLTDRSVWTAAPPNPVRLATAQAVNPQVQTDLATYFYWVVAHYAIGPVICGPFPAFRMPMPTSATYPVVVSWEPAPFAVSYDLLRTGDGCLPSSGQFCALALGLSGVSTFQDEGQPLTPYNMAGLLNGSPVDGWAMMNNRDWSEPVLELFPTVQINKIIYSDGSVQATAGGGPAPVVASVFGRGGAVVAQSGDYNAGQITLSPAVSGWTNVQAAIAGLSAGGVASVNGITGAVTLAQGTGVTIAAAGQTLTISAGAAVPVGASGPSSPSMGTLWYDNSNFRLMIWLGSWIQVA